jgi:hypothetical protein
LKAKRYYGSRIDAFQTSERTGAKREDHPRRNLHYLLHNPSPERDYETRFGIMPLQGPPCARSQEFDAIALGNTENRMDWKFIFLRAMTGSEEGREYTYHGIGNTVLGVEPRGEILPIFTGVPRRLPERGKEYRFELGMILFGRVRLSLNLRLRTWQEPCPPADGKRNLTLSN